ncbi:MAG: type II toxin-antitoxin system RelE/ParE family toxin [Pseudomonadota bacterium]|nr:type II toxin-antitoxin system RelE/ParE family toxin [Pseudomonadota bacterium]
MKLRWTDEALDDLAAIVAYYLEVASPWTAENVERRLVEAIMAPLPFPERIRASDRVPGTRELVVPKLPYIVFVKVGSDDLIVLNIVHTARKFP